jgi:hypothetical protein
MVYGHRRGLERPGLRDPMGPMLLMGLMSQPISPMSPISPIRSQRPARTDLPHASIRRCVLLAPASLTAFPDLWQNPTRVAQEVSVCCYLPDPLSGRV